MIQREVSGDSTGGSDSTLMQELGEVGSKFQLANQSAGVKTEPGLPML